MAVSKDDDQVHVENVLEVPPDMSDVSVVIINVETSDGKQYSFVVGPEEQTDQVSATLTEGYDEAGGVWTLVIQRRPRV